MAGQIQRESRPLDLFDRFDRMLDEWSRNFPVRWPTAVGGESRTFVRTLPLPEGVSEADVKARYDNGILEIRVPMPEPASAKKVEISTT